MTESSQHRWSLPLAFGLVYLFWGSTYLGIAIAVEHIPPALMCATRFLIAGTLMLAYCGLRRGLAGLALGIVGMFVLLWPKLTATGSMGRRELWFSLSLLGGSFSWALGSILSKVWQSTDLDPFSSTAWQVVFAGIANLIFALLNGDTARVVWTPRGIGAVLYLVVGGSWIGYTSYIWLLRHAPSSKVSTYAYVNPVIAVYLGWLVLHEQLDRYILMGSAIVEISVILVTSAKVTAKTVAEELPAVEATGD